MEDTDAPGAETAPETLERFAARYPHFTFRRVPLAAALSLPSIDWTALPPRATRAAEENNKNDNKEEEETAQLREFLARLPSTTSRADVTRLFVRHLLIDTALREDCLAVVLGCSTTALAELTLGETAKGRGHAVPGMLGDGMVDVTRFRSRRRGRDDEEEQEASDGPKKSLALYYPNREVFRGELVTYVSLVEPPIADLVKSPSSYASAAAVVSHRDVSIDDVMARYFVEVEQNYPSIVANVVRTTGKLEASHAGDGEESCGLCGMGLDELGDERWKGEIGDDGGGDDGKLCYGCSRAMRM